MLKTKFLRPVAQCAKAVLRNWVTNSGLDLFLGQVNKLCFLHLLKYLFTQHVRGSAHCNLATKSLAYFQKLRSENEIQRTEIEKMTMTDES